MASNSVSVIDGSTNTVITTVQEHPNQPPHNGDIYVADVYSNTISVIDGKTNTLLGNIPTGGSIVNGVAYDSLNNNIYAVNAPNTAHHIVDPEFQVSKKYPTTGYITGKKRKFNNKSNTSINY